MSPHVCALHAFSQFVTGAELDCSMSLARYKFPGNFHDLKTCVKELSRTIRATSGAFLANFLCIPFKFP